MTEDSSRTTLDSVERAIDDIRNGKAVVVVDNEDRENEGDLIFAASKATPELVAFMVRHTSGYICVAMEDERADELNLPPMVARNQDARSTAYTVTVDAATGTTGISATSRSETITRLADPARGAQDFTRPGHVVPLRAVKGGVLARNGHTEATVDLARMAGLEAVGALCEVVSTEDPADMARLPELRRFADEHDLALISIEQLINHRRRTEKQVELSVATQLPTKFGEFTAHGVRGLVDGSEHIALVCGDVTGVEDNSEVLVRVHSECLTGDVFGSRRCDCGPQLEESMRLIQEAGRGVIVYLRGHEGRGIGLLAKLHAYHLQDRGLDTVDANLEQGLPADAREYSVAGQILDALGVEKARLLTNNPAKCQALTGYGPEIVGRLGVDIEPTPENITYLRTKRDRMGHDLPAVAEWDQQHP
ncbi:bifunctional 3,4-dihydroxy-2-butanone-4-phosphate synthase/GTP cyclohydrolase II [Corynebacterium doosanense]|uniref:Riboflavin biosynthesis protein RibBA n=1 Tax=Corynebacterium doosanense CAU 212 = DSM 45436 TaxID=558173 RepID=A0A097IG77_9CORY|nr:bifunctional 3,4-dihydroxy-2-butanone-4-phosphate synthase/GTP cyclohydrolase II [Corynebacterium doosanense]AIT61148.1 3,4-dihydroxy-2-butanone 4-phosphate synthase [Corynebacterium doosanense CAU 212 = DSM 45436]